MRQLLAGVVAVSLALAQARAQSTGAVPGAYVLESQGSVELKATDGSWRALSSNQHLRLEDRIRVRSGRLRLVGEGGEFRTLEGTAESTVREALRGTEQNGALARLKAFLVRRAELVLGTSKQFSDTGAVRQLPAIWIDLLSPRNTALLEPPERIAWAPQNSAGVCHVTLTDGNGNEVWSGQSQRGAAELGLDARALERDVYYFLVVESVDDPRIRSRKAYFKILSQEDRARVLAEVQSVASALEGRVAPETLELARGAVYEEWDLLEEALDIYRKGAAGSAGAFDVALRGVHIKNGRRWAVQPN